MKDEVCPELPQSIEEPLRRIIWTLFARLYTIEHDLAELKTRLKTLEDSMKFEETIHEC